jgi:hypothetical protein
MLVSRIVSNTNVGAASPSDLQCQPFCILTSVDCNLFHFFAAFQQMVNGGHVVVIYNMATMKISSQELELSALKLLKHELGTSLVNVLILVSLL